MAMRMVSVRKGVGSRRRRPGGAVLEMAVSGVLLCAICFGAIEGGYFLYCKNMMQGAAREGCRVGIVAGGSASQVNNVILNYLINGGLAKDPTHLGVVGGSGPYTISVNNTVQYTITYYNYDFTAGTQSGSISDPSSVPVGNGFVVTITATWGNIGGPMHTQPLHLLDSSKVVYASTTMRKEG